MKCCIYVPFCSLLWNDTTAEEEKDMDRENQDDTKVNVEQISQSMEQDYRRYPHSFEEEDS